MPTSPEPSQLLRGIQALAFGLVLSVIAITLLAGLGAVERVRVSLFGFLLPETSVWVIAVVVAALSTAATALLARGYRSVWGPRREARELSARAEALTLRNSLLEARGEQLEKEILELRERRDRLGPDGDLVVLPDPEQPRRRRRRVAERGSE